MRDENTICFESYTDEATLVTFDGCYIGEISVNSYGEAQIDFNTCWLTRTDMEAIIKKMREIEATNDAS